MAKLLVSSLVHLVYLVANHTTDGTSYTGKKILNALNGKPLVSSLVHLVYLVANQAKDGTSYTGKKILNALNALNGNPPVAQATHETLYIYAY